jgi:hypothetical protein
MRSGEPYRISAAGGLTVLYEAPRHYWLKFSTLSKRVEHEVYGILEFRTAHSGSGRVIAADSTATQQKLAWTTVEDG